MSSKVPKKNMPKVFSAYEELLLKTNRTFKSHQLNVVEINEVALMMAATNCVFLSTFLGDKKLSSEDIETCIDLYLQDLKTRIKYGFDNVENRD